MLNRKKIPIFISIYDFEGSGKTALVSLEALISKNKEREEVNFLEIITKEKNKNKEVVDGA